MLKSIKIGQKNVPVPVPIKNLEHAIEWLEDTLVPKSSVITKITLDGIDVHDMDFRLRNRRMLDSSSVIEIQIESPWELSIKTLDAIRDLAFAVKDKFAEIAVKCWQLSSKSSTDKVHEIHQDMKLILELINHINGIMDYSQKDMAALNGLACLIKRPLVDLEEAISHRNWKKCSHILLNRIEYLLNELVTEAENLQLKIFSQKKDNP